MINKHIMLMFASLSFAFVAVNAEIATAQTPPPAKAKKTAAGPKINTVPKLNIPAEKSYQAQQVNLNMPAPKNLIDLKIDGSKSLPVVKVPANLLKPIPVGTVKQFTTAENITKVPLIPQWEIVQTPVVNEPQTELKNLVEIKPDEYKMIQALIFLDYQKRYDLAMPLFVELMEHPEYKYEATYHYAETALGLKLYSEFREKMIQIAKESKDKAIQKMAVETLVKNIQYLHSSDIGLIDPLTKSFEIDTVNFPTYLLKKAKYHSEKGELKDVEDALLLIPNTAPEYKEGTLLKAVLEYRKGNIDPAIAELEVLWPTIEENKKDQTRNLAALTLARLYFQKAEYKSAYKYYLLVDKSSGQWLQGMVEQAWTQILAGDNEGAAGNMFSLHTEYFSKAYAPDTYVVRTVGYLNLCQYGDGVHVLEDLNKKYKNVYDKLDAYQKVNPQPMSYYDLVKTFLKNSKQDEFDGVPRSFIVELARNPQYMNAQTQINNYEDENSRFNKLTIDLIRKEREARLEMLKAKNEFAAAQREKKTGEELLNLEKKFLAKGIEHLIFERAREGIKKMRESAVARLTSEENALREKAAKNLQTRYTDLVATLSHFVDQQEVLSYEIYSGAGEHIRYQMAGGEAKQADKEPASLTPTEKGEYKWKFKGEVWDDEIGHYRSSLKNVCPQEDAVATGTPNE